MSTLEHFGARPTWRFDRRQRATGLGGAAMLGGLALVLSSSVSTSGAVALGAAGAVAATGLLLPAGLRALSRNRGLGLVVALVGLGALWVIAGVRHASSTGGYASVVLRGGIPYPSIGSPFDRIDFIGGTDWPWRLGRISLLPLVLTALSAAGGLVLLADAVRVQLGLAPLAPGQRAPWRLMTARPERGNRVAWRMVPGVLLVGAAALLAIGLADRYVAGDALLQAMALIGIGGWAAALVGSPIVVGYLMRIDRDKAGRAREEERQRFAAHLHDSVLQTLALVQRQAHDPAAVVRLARRQEHALRAWMAGEAELASETLAAALREIVAEVEDEYRMTVELTAIGDRPLDAKGEALVAAAREALRNAARHAPGAPVFVFCEIARDRAEVFVRDEGPGFDPRMVASERRGIRDAVIGRMAISGGRATIESTPGEGTEVALVLGPGGGR
ncbi:MAG TPA: ATP-binding protein [Solirubrobacteraceae bacterium]|nr:ATP-binding protein [Solirubrobacteraceae bacterium]